MRAPTAETREKQRPYVELFTGAAPVLDVGCGRGEFLALLRDAGIEATGVDADGDMVAFARGEGLDVTQADALDHLEGLEPGSLGGVFAAQLVEHLPPASLVRLLGLAHAALREDGVLVLETINPLSPLALRNFFADLTHAQPLVPETLQLLALGRRLPRALAPLRQPAGRAPDGARRPAARRERAPPERAPLRAARLRARRPALIAGNTGSPGLVASRVGGLTNRRRPAFDRR